MFFLVSDATFKMVPVIFWCFAVMLSTSALCGTFYPLSVFVNTDRLSLPPLGITSVPLRTGLERVVFHEMEVFFLASLLPRLADLKNRQQHTLLRSSIQAIRSVDDQHWLYQLLLQFPLDGDNKRSGTLRHAGGSTRTIRFGRTSIGCQPEEWHFRWLASLPS